MTEIDFEPKKIQIRPLDRDTDVPAPSQDVWVEIRSADLDGGLPPKTWGFKQTAELLVPSLLDLPARTRGEFTELAVDLYAPLFPAHPDYIYEVDLLLRKKLLIPRYSAILPRGTSSLSPPRFCLTKSMF